MEEKKMVWVTVRVLTCSDFDGDTLDKAIARLVGYKKELEGKELRFDVDYGYEESDKLNLQVFRLETDEEFKARLEKEEYDRQNRERWDKEKYEELKKKFEGK